MQKKTLNCNISLQVIDVKLGVEVGRGTSLEVQWLRLPFNAGDAGFDFMHPKSSCTKTPHVTGQLSPPTTTRGAHTEQPKPSIHTHTHTHTHTHKVKKKKKK